jgi:pimeloyl-ACP methyl ester carboxylesterase
MKRLARRVRGLTWAALLLLLLPACSSAGNGGAAPVLDPDVGSGDSEVGIAETPCTPIAAASETVTVKNEFGSLEGTLLVPDGCGPIPVVVILSGSGTTDRDGNQPPDPVAPSLYRILAETVRDAGFAVLRYDDPGIGKSVTGGPAKNEDFRYEMEVEDAALFIVSLRKDARFNAIVPAGHSQGSLTGILVAQKQTIDGFISLAGAGRPVGKLLHEQLAPKLSAAQLAELDSAIAKLEGGELAGPLTPPLDQILPVDVQPYFISWMKYDPKAEIAKLRGPALLLQGRFDLQVSELDATLLSEGRPDAKLVFVDDMGHMLRKVTAKTSAAQQSSYSKPLPLHPAAVDALSEFLHALPKK